MVAKVSVLQANFLLVEKGKSWTWNQSCRGSILTRGNNLSLDFFLFLRSKASDANNGIIANVVCL